MLKGWGRRSGKGGTTGRRIKALQVEVSTACQLACRYCPRTVLAERWRSEVMPWDVFEYGLAPHFSGFELIFLQGWGEPLLNPRFWDMAELVKKRGCQAGFVTNALLWDEQAKERCCELAVDLACFTFAGATAATHGFYRAEADFGALTEKIRRLAAAKAARGLTKPVIGINFTMMRGNMAELAAAVGLAAELGANQFIANHLDCIPAPSLEEHTVFLAPRPEDVGQVAAAGERAARAGIFFRAEPPRLGGEILACEANPLHTTLFVRVDGTVVPCHQMALPPDIVENIYFHGASRRYEPVVFGNAAAAPLPVILAGREAQEMFACFARRANPSFSPNDPIPDAPPLCRACYKLYGA